MNTQASPARETMMAMVIRIEVAAAPRNRTRQKTSRL
jgi:hypothetical protein